jgi:peptide/nickel transport system substrate-binding protein
MPALRFRSALVAATVLALVGGAAACAQSKRNETPAAKDTMVFGTAGEAKVLDPTFASDGESFRVARQVFDNLVMIEPGTAKIVPGLALSWTPDAAGTTWTFKLRQGVKFHDGTPFDATAVCKNFDRWYNFTGLLQTPDVTSYYQDIFGGFAKNERPELGQSLYKSCTAKAADEAQIALTRITSKFPAALVLPAFSMQSPAAMQQFQADTLGGSADSITYPSYAMEHPTGSGPFKFEKWDRANKTITLVRNDDYWGTKAKLKRLIFKAIPDENARKQALNNNEIDGYDLPSPADLPSLKAAGFNLQARPAFNILYLAITQTNPQLAKLEVRQAIAYALNREAMVKAKLPDGAQVATQFHPPTLDGWNPNVTKYNYDPNKAKALLAQAGASNLTLKFFYPTDVTRPYMPDPKSIFELFKADLEAVGIKIEPHALKWSPEYLAAVQAGQADIHLLGWTGDYSDAYNFIGTFFDREKPQFGFKNQALFDAFRAADSTADATTRYGLYQQLNAMIMDFLPAIPISHSPPSIVFGKNVTGIKASPLADERFFQAEFKAA